LPWCQVGEFYIYPPWRLFEWWFEYGAYAPDVFERAGWIAASGGPLAWGVAVTMAVKRSRTSSAVTTYGSARWASSADIAQLGLLAERGVFVGALNKHERTFLRHAGAEH